MKIGVFGGSFDPIHNGHIILAQYALEHTDLEQLWLMVSPRNPLKDHGPLATDEQRLEMARLAVADIPGIEVSDFEFNLPRPSYTYLTLSELQKAYPEHKFSLLIGGDNWANFRLWRNPDEIISRFGVIVYPRPDIKANETENKIQIPENGQQKTDDGRRITDNIIFLENAPLMPISATQIRSLLSSDNLLSINDNKLADFDNSSLEYALHPSVLEYIRNNSLYA